MCQYNGSNYSVDGALRAKWLRLSHLGSACKVQEEIMMKWTTGNGFVSYYRRKLRGPSGFKGNKEVRLRSSSSGARQNRVWVLPILWYLSHQSGDSQCGPPLRYPQYNLILGCQLHFIMPQGHRNNHRKHSQASINKRAA